jgi:hypothetical protein
MHREAADRVLLPMGCAHDGTAAVERAETVLLPAFDSWRSGGVRMPS